MPPRLRQGEPESLRLTKPVPLSDHPAEVYLESLAEGSKPTMSHALNTMASIITEGKCDAVTLDWSKLRYKHTSRIRTQLKNRYDSATVNKMISALRRVLKEALRLDLIDYQDYLKAADLGKVAHKPKIRGRALSQEEISDLLSACFADTSPAGKRDAAMIGILRGCGLRRAELVALDLRDFDPKTRALEVRKGKGDKYRRVYIPQSAMSLVSAWLKVRGNVPGALLCPIRRGGRIEIRHLIPHSVLLILQRRAKQAGVESFSPHDFRRTFCSDLLDAGVDIVTVQKLAGHSSPVTTAKYDRRGEETKRLAVDKLGF